MTETLCTTNRIILYEIHKKTKRIEVTGDSFGLLEKGKIYKSLSELEKLIFNKDNNAFVKKEENKSYHEISKKH